MRADHFEIFSTSIAQLIKAVQYLKNRKMAQYGLKGSNALCLCQILESEDGLTAGELATAAEIDKAQVSRCMAELIEKSFVYREESEGRRYKQKYRLTPEGECAAKDVQATARRIQEAVGKDVSDDDLDVFYGTLYKLCENFAELLEQEQ